MMAFKLLLYASKRSLTLVLGLVFAFSIQAIQAQDFQQQFTGGVVGDYDDGTANEFNAISSSGSGVAWSITGNKLRSVRTGSNAGAATRTTNLTAIEAANTAMLRFKFQVVASGGSQTNAGIVYIGKSFSTANGTEANADVHARVGFNFTATSGTYQFREIGSATNSGNFTGEQSVLLVTNNSGVSKTYQAPDGTYEAVANDRFDIWVGSTRIFNDATATDPFTSNSISDFKILFNQGSGTVEIDDILIDPIPETPTATAATSIGSGSFTANWGTVTGSTGYRLDVSTSNTFSSFVPGYNNLAVTGTSQTVSGLSSSTTYYYRVRAERAYTVATNTSNHSNTITATTTAGGGPSIAISSSSPAASTHSPGATNVVLTRIDLAVTVANATLNGLTVTTAGTYAASDLSNLKVRYSTDAILDGSDATLSTKTTGLGAGSQAFPSFTSQTINSGTTGYLFITADLASSFTTGGATLNMASTVFSNISFVSGSKTGTDPVPAGNTRTLLKAEPTNNPSSFVCGTTTTTTIPLSWTDASGGTTPDGYLIRWSTTSFAAITDPVDGTAVANGSTAQNVTQGTGTFTPTGLSIATTYYFKIYAYTNSGGNIDYKLTGIQQTSCATQSAPWEDFETGSNITSYGGSGTFTAGNWILTDALATTGDASDFKNGTRSVRIRSTGNLAMNFDLTTGLGTVTVLHGMYGGDANGTWRLEASTDGGSSWTAFTSSTYTATASTFASQSIVVNLSGTVRFRIVKLSTSGTSNRLNIDDIYVTSFGCTSPAATTGVTPANPTSDGINLSWTGSAGDGTMLVLRQTTAGNLAPASGTSYTANTVWASAGQINTNNRVMFRASGSSVSGITGLNAETQYTATAYNYNNSGDCYRISGAATTTFRTLSLEPSTHAASFTSTADSPTQITLNFSPASSIPNADGYLIFRRTGATPTFTPSDATAYIVGTTYGDAVLRGLITSTSTNSFVDNSGLSGNNTYHYILVPYNWDGTNTTTYNYRLAATIPATNATTPAAVPEIQLEQPLATNVSCGFNYDYGSHLLSTNTDVTIRVRNTGTGTLNISSVTITGADASEFSIQTSPSAATASGSFSDMVIRFTPTTGGSKAAIATINNDDSDEPSCTINLYGEGDATPVVPTLSSPTVSSITNNSATLGATITSDGNATITARGTVWKTSAGVTASDNALAEGGTAVSPFSHSRTSLPSGTRIYYRGYATNSAGTGLSSEADFYTLSNEPGSGPASFTATAVSATQINLSFSAASSIPASGYIIFIKAGSAITGAPSDATAYAINDAVGDANVTALITTATSFAVSGLSAGTTYHFSIFPFSWNGANNETRNYRTTSPLTANATTNTASLPVLGDIAFVAYATDAPDRFAFVALADIAANAEIAFTDNAWSSGSALCNNEETVRWKAPAAGVSKGTVVRIQSTTANIGSIISGSLNNLSTSGDQIFAFTGTAGSPTFIAGLSSTSFAGSCHACTNTNTSCIASGLSNGTNAISFASHADNGYYVGETYGTAATLRAAINNPANWVRSGSNQLWPTPWSFVIGNVSITTGTITGSPFCITNTTGIAVSVPFTTGGTFETGNVFTAQLSDANGSFAIPTDIGTGTISPISATIPAATLTGNGYRIRVISSDPEANGLQNTVNLNVLLNTPDVSGVSALRQNGGAIVSWTNPGGCWDQVLVVTQPTNAFTATPTGDGTAYAANSTFLSGTSFGTGGSVVFNGTGSSLTITGFTNGVTYYVKVFVRRGTVWSDGVEVSVVPSPDVAGDFRSRVTTGNWSNFSTWERFNGTAWVNATSGQFPDNNTTTVTIQNGHTITVDGSSDPYDVKNVIVAAGGKLYANTTSTNRYLSVYGDITCNGVIGNGSTFDGISFNFQGTKSTISGTGTFDCSRLRKNDDGPTGTTTDLIIAMHVNLRWNASSGTTIYNNDGRSPGSRFNVTVNENSTLNCVLSTGGTSGNASIDGVDGSNSATSRAGGTFTINGTMNIPGTLYATTDNDATGGYFCRWVIGSTGVINCRQLDFAASGAAGHTFTIKNGGKLNLNNNNDNTTNPVVNFSTTNNTYTFETNSTVEYSSTDLTGSQKIFLNAALPYQNLLLSGQSTKQLQTVGTLVVNGDLRITGGTLDIQTNNIDLKGNWENYNQSGFTEGNQKVTFSGTGLQTITCVGGEKFYNVDITNSSLAGVRLDADVTLSNDLDLFTNGRLSFGATPSTLTLSKMVTSSNTLKGSGTANIDMSAAEHVMIIGCPDPSYSGTLNAGSTSTIIYNRDEDFVGSADDQNILTGFTYANLLMQGKGNKVVSGNLTVTGNFTAETPDLVLSVPITNRTFTLGGNFTLNSGATMNDNCRSNQEIITSGNALQLFNTHTKNLKAFNLKSVKTAGGISLNGDIAGQTTVNLQNDFALDYTGSAVFTDNGNILFVGDDAELGSVGSTASNFNITGTLQFDGLGAATDIHLSDYAATGRTRAELNHVIIRAGENASIDQLEVYPTTGGQTVTFKGNLEIIQGTNNSEFDLNNNTLNLGGNWTNYNQSGFLEGTSSTVVFNGSTAQTISGAEIFRNLTLNNASGLTLSNSVQVRTNLTMTNGNIHPGASNVLTLGESTASPGTLSRSAGRITGSFRRWFAPSTNSGASTGLFPIGNSLYDDFVQVEYTTAPSAGGTLTATFKNEDMALFGVPTTNYLIPSEGSCTSSFLVTRLADEGFWEMDDADGLTGGIYDIRFEAEGIEMIADLCQLTALKRVGTGQWLESGSHKAPSGTLTRPVIVREGASGWSNWGFGGGNTNPLPIELLSFNATALADHVALNWTTASETNNAWFEVQRSINLVDWEMVCRQPGAGNSNTVLQYADKDLKPLMGIAYYRLKQSDFDGTTSLSKPVAVRYTSNDALWAVSTFIPQGQTAQIILSRPVHNLKMEIFDAAGRIVQTAVLDSKTTHIQLNTSELSRGLYSIRLHNAEKVELLRMFH